MKSLQIQTKSKGQVTGDESGQASVESILLIAISVLIILGLMSQFYKPLDRYLSTYMGPYLTCLLDVGELPSLGGGAVSGECNIDNFELGPTREAGVGGKGGGSSSGNQANSKSEGKGGSSGDDTESANLKDKDDSGGSGFAGRSGRGEEFGSKGSDGSRVEGKVVQEVPEELAATRYFKVSQSGGSSGGGGRRRFIAAQGIAGVIAQEKEKLERRQGRIRSFVASSLDETKRKKMIVKPQQRKVAEASAEESWSFGQIFRIALIVMIVVAIVLFIGGQVLSISKGMDK